MASAAASPPVEAPVYRRLVAEVGAAGLPDREQPSTVTEADIESLPEAARRYLGFMQVVGEPRRWSFQVRAVGRFRRRPGRSWMTVEAWQYNSAVEVTRIFVMQAHMTKLVSLLGQDTYMHGHGRLTIQLFGRLTVADGKGAGFDQGQLLIWLNDAVFLAPSMLLGPAVSWSAVSDDAFDLAFADGGTTVRARVFLDERGAPIAFHADRYAVLPSGTALTPWRTPVKGWREVKGRPFPRHFSAVYDLPDGPFCYIEGHFDAGSLAYNLKPLSPNRSGSRRPGSSPAPATRPGTTQIPIYRTEEIRARLMALYDEKLRQWPVPFDAFSVSTRHGKTHVIASGDAAAPPIVLLHPESVTGLTWSPITAALSSHCRLYALDTIGDMGRSELADFDDYLKKGPDFSVWVSDVCAELGVQRADVIGGSMGGWIALNHAIEAPDRVRNLVLLGPMGLASWLSMLRLFWPMMSLLAHSTDAKRDRMIKLAIGEGERADRELVPWLKIVGKLGGRTGWPIRISDERLRKIRAPTLLFLGGKDDAIGNPTPVAERARGVITGCAVELLPNAAHMMMCDEPDFISDRVLQFLQGAEGREGKPR